MNWFLFPDCNFSQTSKMLVYDSMLTQNKLFLLLYNIKSLNLINEKFTTHCILAMACHPVELSPEISTSVSLWVFPGEKQKRSY